MTARRGFTADIGTWIAGTLQIIVALLVVLSCGVSAYYALRHWNPWHGILLYNLLMNLTDTLLGIGIIAIVIVEISTRSRRAVRVLYETAKSIAATCAWLWYLLDALYGPWQNTGDKGKNDFIKDFKVMEAVFALCPLIVVFYLVLVVRLVQWAEEKKDLGNQDIRRTEDAESNERLPLLSDSPQRSL